jgi:hypothetical protein
MRKSISLKYKQMTNVLKINSLVWCEKKTIIVTLFSFVTTVNYKCLVEGMQQGFHQLNIKEILYIMKVHNGFSYFDILYVKMYVFFYELASWKIKGFNYLGKLFFNKESSLQ